MGLRITDTYAKLWNVENKGKYSVVELSVSRKNKETGNYETDFQSKFVRFVGNAHTAVQNLVGNERIKIVSGDVSNHYDAEKKTTYTNYVVFAIETLNGNGNSQAPNDGFVSVPDSTDDEVPFN